MTDDPFERFYPRAPWTDLQKECFYRELLQNTQARLTTLQEETDNSQTGLEQTTAIENVIALATAKELKQIQQKTRLL